MMAGRGGVTLVVRTFNSIRTLDKCVESIREQTVPARVLVVDSGSQDGTIQRAEAISDEVIVRDPYSPGGALNAGTQAAETPIVAALSSHSAFETPRWLELALDLFEDPEVVAVCGASVGPDGSRLAAPFTQTLAGAQRNPWWGLSNTASAWRRDAVVEHPFPENTMTDDKAWAWKQLQGGRLIAFSPDLIVAARHRRGAGALAYFRRRVVETRGVAMYAPLPAFGLLPAARALVSQEPPLGMAGGRPLRRTRAIEVAARYVGQRQR
jgi:glycosyltransferase involved in cell wall biosynthesis